MIRMTVLVICGFFIEEYILPKCYNEIVKNIKDYSETSQFRRLYAKSNPRQVYDSMIRLITDYKKNNHYKKNGSLIDKKNNIDWTDYLYTDIAGICLKGVKCLSNYSEYDNVANSDLIPDSLPRGYPEVLRKEALYAIKVLINNLEKNAQGWTNLVKRKESLQHELFLFSKGKHGIEGKHPKIKKQIKSKSKSKSKKSKSKSKTKKSKSKKFLGSKAKSKSKSKIMKRK